MKLGIAKRITLAFGLLLFLFFITAAVGVLLAGRIDDEAALLADPESLRPEPVYALREALEAATAALAAQPTPDAPVEAWLPPFDEAAERFLAAARQLDGDVGVRTEAAIADLRGRGGRLNRAADQQLQWLAEIEAASRVLAAGLTDVAGGREAAERLERLAQAATTHARRPGPALREAEAEAASAFARAQAVRRAGADDAGQAAAVEAEARFAALGQALDRLAASGEARARLQQAFEDDAAALADALGGEVLAAMWARRGEARASVRAASSQLIVFLCVMTAFGGVMGASAALVVIRGIVRPLVALTDGARTIAGGQLEHRIPLEGDDEFGRLASSINRMAERRLRSEEALRQAANQDSLTRLPNRVVFQDRLVEALDSANRIERLVAVLMLDLDHFKDVNDTLGHPSGDALLKQVAERLLECARKSDTVSRLGGDEFGIIMTNLNSVTGVEVLARRIIGSIGQPFDIDGERVYTGTSIGITVFPHDDREADKLIKNADMALYRAKQEGRNKYVLYDAEMNAVVQERKALEQDLRDALAADDLFLNFQPKMELETGRIVGAEALVRWYHEGRGMVSPGLFIPVAEEAGMITAITDMVLRKVCRQIREWQQAGHEVPRISLNLSPADFKRENLSDVVRSAFETAGIEPRFLELEITEGMAMGMSDGINSFLNEMRELGIRIAIDDFGTGYSSMAYLSRFPIDALKIDQTFVRKIVTDSDSANITSAIIHLAQSLHVDVVAEGVEEEAQYLFLRERGCTEIQGYWISRPVHATGFMEFTLKHNAAIAAHGGIARSG